MSKKDLLFQKIFGSNNVDGKLLSEVADKELAKFVYDTAKDESKNHWFRLPVTTYDKNKDATIRNIEAIIELFESERKEREIYLSSFEKCSPLIKDLIKQLKKNANDVEEIKEGSRFLHLVSGVGGTLASVGLCVACAPAAVVFASAYLALTGVLAGGTSIVENTLTKGKLKEARILIHQIETEFKVMEKWFSFPKKLKENFEKLIGGNILAEIKEDVKKFFHQIYKQAKMTVDEFKERFKEELKKYMKKMSLDRKISGLDDELGPIVKTFLVVCLIKSSNPFALDTKHETLNSMFGAFGFINAGAFVGDFLVAPKGAGAVLAKLLAPVNVVLNIILVAESVKDLSGTSELGRQINEAVQQFKTSLLFLENVYNQLKEVKYIYESNVTEWESVLILKVPRDAQQADIKRAFKPYVPKEAHGCIKLERAKTEGNNWFVKVPKTHSLQLFWLSDLEINNQRCQVCK